MNETLYIVSPVLEYYDSMGETMALKLMYHLGKEVSVRVFVCMRVCVCVPAMLNRQFT